MAIPGFAKLPNAVMEYARAGGITPSDLGIYGFLLLNCNWTTGIYRGTALGVALQFDDAKLQSLVKKALHRLRSAKLINYRQGSGKRGAYEILIHGFEPTSGARSGYRLNAWKHGEKAIPEYESGAVEDVEEAVEGVRSSGGNAAEEARKSGGRVAEAARTPDEPDGSEEEDISDIQIDRRNTDAVDDEKVQVVRKAAADTSSSSTSTGDTPVPPSGNNPRTPAERLTRLMLFRFFEYGADDVTTAFYNKTLAGAEKLLSHRKFDEAKALLKFAKGTPRWVKAFKGADTPMAYFDSDGVWNALKKGLETAPPPSKAEATPKPKPDSNIDPFAQWEPRKAN
jgi:hypothetical protein